jgi:hypothetical protein
METPRTPEQLVMQMSLDEVRELLASLGMDRSATSAQRLKLLIKLTHCLETAIEILDEEFRLPQAA